MADAYKSARDGASLPIPLESVNVLFPEYKMLPVDAVKAGLIGFYRVWGWIHLTGLAVLGFAVGVDVRSPQWADMFRLAFALIVSSAALAYWHSTDGVFDRAGSRADKRRVLPAFFPAAAAVILSAAYSQTMLALSAALVACGILYSVPPMRFKRLLPMRIALECALFAAVFLVGAEASSAEPEPALRLAAFMALAAVPFALIRQISQAGAAGRLREAAYLSLALLAAYSLLLPVQLSVNSLLSTSTLAFCAWCAIQMRLSGRLPADVVMLRMRFAGIMWGAMILAAFLTS
jgi:hypothetical protein